MRPKHCDQPSPRCFPFKFLLSYIDTLVFWSKYDYVLQFPALTYISMFKPAPIPLSHRGRTIPIMQMTRKSSQGLALTLLIMWKNILSVNRQMGCFHDLNNPIRMIFKVACKSWNNQEGMRYWSYANRHTQCMLQRNWLASLAQQDFFLFLEEKITRKYWVRALELH